MAMAPDGTGAQEGVAAPRPAQEAGPPVPVLLVPGWFDTGADLARFSTRLREAGWPPDRILALTFADRTGSNRGHALEVAAAVGALRARTGAARVDIVAHSMGGLATRLYLRDHAGAVRRVVFLGTPHRGTWAAYLAFGEGRNEMLPGSRFLQELNAGRAVPPGVEAMTVRTLLDTHILPGESAMLAGVRSLTVCCSTHWGLTRDREVFDAVRDFLRREEAP